MPKEVLGRNNVLVLFMSQPQLETFKCFLNAKGRFLNAKKLMYVIFDETWYIYFFPFELQIQPHGKKCFK